MERVCVPSCEWIENNEEIVLLNTKEGMKIKFYTFKCR